MIRPSALRRCRGAAAYALTALLSVLILVRVLGLRKATLTVPFNYGWDNLNNLMVIKGLIENGWHLHNDAVGAPAGLDLHDYPFAGNLDLLIIKLIGWAVPDCAAACNLFFLLTFPLAALTAMFACRRFGLSRPVAAVAGLLFTFLPFHFLRGEPHLFIGAYYTVPLVLMVALWIYEGRPVIFRPDVPRWPRLAGPNRYTLGAVVVGLLAACGMPYYAFFACYFLLVAGASAALGRRSAAPLLAAGTLVLIIVAGFVANLTPNLLYVYRYGPNPLNERQPSEAEWNGLKVVQLLAPVTNHRAEALAAWKTEYRDHSPLVGENDLASLGLIGSAGFLLLLARLLRLRAGGDGRLADGLALLNVFAVLLGTIGGLGALFSWLVSAWIRSYNRISVWIAFLALLAVFLVIERWAVPRLRAWPARVLYAGMLALLLAGGVWDQTTPAMAPVYAELRKEYASDEAFIQEVEGMLPAGAMVWQMPFMAYPENGRVHAMEQFDHFKAYLHSKHLRWSFGAMKGRQDDWQRRVAALPTDRMIEELRRAGFRGIYVDRRAYPDGAAALEGELSGRLHGTPVVSPDGRLAFFVLGPAGAGELARQP